MWRLSLRLVAVAFLGFLGLWQHPSSSASMAPQPPLLSLLFCLSKDIYHRV